MKIVCCIPARGGSKRLPRKNVKEIITGVPLISLAVRKAKKCLAISEVWVSTDDISIRDCALQEGAFVLDRPDKLAGDDATTEEVLLDFAEKIDFDVLILYECTFPLTTVIDFNALVTKYLDMEFDSVISMERTTDFVWEESIGGGVFPPYELGKSPLTQKFEGILIERGGLYITSKKCLQEDKARVSGRIGFIEVNTPSIEIDTEDDFKMAEACLK